MARTRTAGGVPLRHLGWLWSKMLDTLAGSAAAQGDTLYRGASQWTRLAAGSSRQILTTFGASADPAWANLGAGVYAGSDKTKTNDTTLGADPDTALQVTLGANKKYRLKYDIYWDTGATPDLKWDLDFTGTTTSVLFMALKAELVTANLATGATQSTFQMRAASALNVVVTDLTSATNSFSETIICGIQTGASGGTFSLRWAQNTSSGTATTRRRDSSILVTECT